MAADGTHLAPVDEAVVERVVQAVIVDADLAALKVTYRPGAERTHAAVTAAMRCAIANGLVVVTAAGEWPDQVVGIERG